MNFWNLYACPYGHYVGLFTRAHNSLREVFCETCNKNYLFMECKPTTEPVPRSSPLRDVTPKQVLIK